MKTKDITVGTKFHPLLTSLLFKIDSLYRKWQSELIITSGSESRTKHSYTSLHYALPCQAIDIRIWQILGTKIPDASEQFAAIKKVSTDWCIAEGFPVDWVDVILESDHIHLEFQPKRQKY